MFDLQLNDQQVAMLHKILESYLSDLRVEIAGTDLVEFRDVLKKEEVFIKELLRRLAGETVTVPH